MFVHAQDRFFGANDKVTVEINNYLIIKYEN